ncbi:MAG: cyclodeaminase/cyclohydrolase family protein, partial [Candidatus Omnitrophica bacterium]|nr:cyclodeaminase/cyclohydrolase family protein [Candidatus Omnitrophota bacterium]
MAEIKSSSISVFIKQLKSKTSSPGGGSAAAIVLSLSLALYKKCLNFSSGNFSGPELKRAQLLIEGYLEDSLKLADKDRDVYLALRDLFKNKDCSSSELTDAYKDAGLVP